jgi:hypothetical protein
MGATGESGDSTTSTRPRTLAHAYALALDVPADAPPAPTRTVPPRPRHAAPDPNPDPWAAIDVVDLPWLDDDPRDSRAGRARRRRAAVALSGALASLGLGTVALSSLDGDRPQRPPESTNPTTTRPSDGLFARPGEPSTTASTTAVDPMAGTGTEVVEEPTEVEGITRTTVRRPPPTTTPTTRRPSTPTTVPTTVPASTTTTTTATTTTPTTAPTTTTTVPETTTTTTEGEGGGEP